MSTVFITKRPHKKSRQGCGTCKKRKIKCDEALPKCTFCEKRDLPCDYTSQTTRVLPKNLPLSSAENRNYPSPIDQDCIDSQEFSPPITTIIRSPTPAIPTKTGILSQADLKGMHFWSLFTSQTLTGSHAVSCLQVTVPQLAFENDYLLNVMLGISSLHMQSLSVSSDRRQQELGFYRAKSFAGFRKALANLDPLRPAQWESALITSILLNLLCARDYKVEEGDLVVLNWLTLYRGLSTVVEMRSFEDVLASNVGSIFRRSLNHLQTGPMVPQNLYQMFETVPRTDPDYPFLKYYRKILDFIGVLYASLLQDGLSPAFCTRVVAWCSLAGQTFTALAKEKRPRALILLAYYMVFVKCASGLIWWLEKVSDEEIKRIFKMVPPKWFPLLDMPKQSLDIEGADDLRFWLLCSVDETLVPVYKAGLGDYEEAIKTFSPDSDTHDDCIKDVDSMEDLIPYRYTRCGPATKLPE